MQPEDTNRLQNRLERLKQKKHFEAFLFGIIRGIKLAKKKTDNDTDSKPNALDHFTAHPRFDPNVLGIISSYHHEAFSPSEELRAALEKFDRAIQSAEAISIRNPIPGDAKNPPSDQALIDEINLGNSREQQRYYPLFTFRNGQTCYFNATGAGICLMPLILFIGTGLVVYFVGGQQDKKYPDQEGSQKNAKIFFIIGLLLFGLFRMLFPRARPFSRTHPPEQITEADQALLLSEEEKPESDSTAEWVIDIRGEDTSDNDEKDDNDAQPLDTDFDYQLLEDLTTEEAAATTTPRR